MIKDYELMLGVLTVSFSTAVGVIVGLVIGGIFL